ncbi:MAG: glycosyltransferase family 4 protein [Nitrospirae bacterium]|nr:glycosyltransferase family 4 protein [Nitrospirota bacterium]
MQKKVCIIHKVKPLDPRSFYKQGRSALRAGYDTTIMGFYPKDKVVNGIKLVGFNYPAKRLSRFLTSNYQVFIRALKEKADIYHFHDLDFIPWAVLLKIITSRRVIYDIHEAHPEYMLLKAYVPKFFRRILSALIYLLEHAAANFFDAIVPNDNYVAKDFNHKRNEVIFNFPTLDFFKDSDSIPWQKREFDLFYHGSLPKYHFELMMSVAERLNSENVRNVWGIVMNEGSPSAWAKQEVQKRRLEGNFIFLPYTDYLNIFKYLTNAKIGIIPLPSYKKFMKNIPLKMFEFMGFGMPMVLSDLPPSRQFIKGENCAVSVEPDNINEYANAIKFLLGNPEKAVEMGKNGRRLVFEKYNWANEEKKLLGLYSGVLC